MEGMLDYELVVMIGNVSMGVWFGDVMVVGVVRPLA